MKKLLLVLFLIASVAKQSPAQNPIIDSLLTVLKTVKEDTTRVNTLNTLSREYLNTGDFEKGLQYANDALALANASLQGRNNRSKLPDKEIASFLAMTKAKATSYNNIGIIHYSKGDYAKALEYFLKSLKLREESGDKNGMASSYNSIGNIHNSKGDYTQALQYHLKCLKIMEETGNKQGMAISYNNIGNINNSKGDYGKALEYHLKCLKIMEEIGNIPGMAVSYNNIGSIYHDKGDNDRALEFHLKSLKIKEEIGDTQGMGDSYHNIGTIHQVNGDYAKALEFYLKSLKIDEEDGDKQGMASSYNNIGIIHYNKGDYAKALEFHLKALKLREEIGEGHGMAMSYHNIGNVYLKENNPAGAKFSHQKSLAIAKEIAALPDMMGAYEGLAKADSALGNFKSAYEYHKLYTQTKDSIFNEEANKKSVQAEMNFEFEKKEAVAKAEQQKKEAVAAAENKKQKVISWSATGGAGLMLMLCLVAVRGYRNKRKAHGTIAHQKALVEEKNKDITDSINYAKRLQQAILPSQKLVKAHLKDSFILYKPKDIVAGDFYWMETIKDIVLFAAADCTGHGVPGAIVSVVCSNALNRTVKEFGITEPGKILDKVTDLVIETFEKSESEVNDGMDISLCAFNKTTKEILWAGANNPLWILKKNKTELTEIKPDKQPIGKFANRKLFTTHAINVSDGDTLYLFTDGFADQFGGEKGKKFKSGKLKELLLSINHEPMIQQKQVLEESFETWKGRLEQIDDVCVIGVRV